MFLLYAVVTFVICLLLQLGFKRRNPKFPPGPPNFPIIGSLLSVISINAKDPAKAFAVLSRKYGPIVGLQMGSVKTVAISGYEKLNQVANSDALLARTDEADIWVHEKSSSHQIGLSFSGPEFGAKTRAYTLKTLKKYDLALSSQTKGFVIDEIVEFCDDIKSQMTNGEVTLSLHHQFAKLFFNIVWTFLTDKKFSTKGTNGVMLESIEDYVRVSKFSGSITQIFPGVIPIFPELTGFNALKERCQKWKDVIKAEISTARGYGTYKRNPENFLEEFLQKTDSTPKPKNVQDTIFTEENLTAVLQDIQMGGTDTQSVTAVLFVRFLLENPHVQQKLQEEVDIVIGNTRLVSVDDISSLNYLQATIAETLRIGNVAPVIPRKVLKDWVVDGFTIPKGTLVVLNIWSGDNDERVYENPALFKPERFLSETGKYQNGEKLFAFGFGKRRCIAEQYTRVWIPLLFATLIQSFSFHVDPAFGTKWGPEKIGLARCPAPFNVIVKSRETDI